jgi:hypothetical protein
MRINASERRSRTSACACNRETRGTGNTQYKPGANTRRPCHGRFCGPPPHQSRGGMTSRSRSCRPRRHGRCTAAMRRSPVARHTLYLRGNAGHRERTGGRNERSNCIAHDFALPAKVMRHVRAPAVSLAVEASRRRSSAAVRRMEAVTDAIAIDYQNSLIAGGSRRALRLRRTRTRVATRNRSAAGGNTRPAPGLRRRRGTRAAPVPQPVRLPR